MNKNVPVFTCLLFVIFTFLTTAQVFDWEWQNPTPTGADHNDAIVLSATKFILTGNGGSVLISTNAGTTWSQQYIDPQARDIYSATFVNENIGYVAGTGECCLKQLMEVKTGQNKHPELQMCCGMLILSTLIPALL